MSALEAKANSRVTRARVITVPATFVEVKRSLNVSTQQYSGHICLCRFASGFA